MDSKNEEQSGQYQKYSEQGAQSAEDHLEIEAPGAVPGEESPSTRIPSGRLERLKARHRESLRDVSTLDLLHELTARLTENEQYPTSEEGIAVGKLLQDHLARLIDVHNNRFSRSRLRDYYYAYMRPHRSTKPAIKEATWVELGAGSQNPAAFLFLLLMLGAKR